MSRQEERFSHRTLKSSTNPGKQFTEPWVGDNPTVSERVGYITKYFMWMRKLDNPRADIYQYRMNAAHSVSKALFKSGRDKVETNIFRYWVDRAAWIAFFADRGNDELQPVWPWQKPPADANRGFSKTYKLFRTQLKMTEEQEEFRNTTSRGSRKRPAEPATDKPAKRAALEHDNSHARQKGDDADCFIVTVTHEIGQDGWPLIRYQANRG